MLEECVPKELADSIIKEFEKPAQPLVIREIEKFFSDFKISRLFPEFNVVLSNYKQKELLTAEDFGW